MMSTGARVGVYEIVGPIGAGGMGEVYRARDSRLDRDVAIKILPDAFASDPERLARFEREAKTLAALNHPHIASIYAIEQNALVMELVEGDDLSARIARGPISLDEALRIARQIAQALDAAHERAIIHRDLKPANIKVRDDGTVKVLDFGLAKALDPVAGSHPDLMNSPTITSPATQLGMILGTAAYMAPEQAKGRPVDKRADIWAFGCVLYEMLTAKRAFAGSDVSETLASVLARDVDWSALPPATPKPVVALLRACLQKEKGDRLRDLGDAWLHFEAAADAAPVASRRGRAAWVPWAVAAAAVIAALSAGIRSMRIDPAVPFHLSIALPDGYRITSSPVISSDGRRIAFAAGDGRSRPKLYVRDVETFDTRELAGTGGADRPFLSPDGRWIGYFASGYLHTLDLNGGAPTRLTPAPSNGGGAWAEDGTIVFVPTWNGGLYKIASRGGEPQLLITPDPAKKEYAYTSPHFLPDGRELLFATWGAAFNIERLTLPGLERAIAATDLWGAPAYATSGHVLTPNNAGDLLAIPYPPRPDGAPVSVMSNIHWRSGAGDGVMKFAVSGNGTLVYAPSDITQRRLAFVDEQGRAVAIPGDMRPYDEVSVAPDGRRAAVNIDGEVQIVDLARGTRAPVHPGKGAQTAAIWSIDGSRLLFAANAEGNWEIYQSVPGRTDPPAIVLRRASDQFPLSIAPDGTLLFLDIAPGMGGNLWLLAPGGTATSWLATDADEAEAVFSRDGSLVAYMSNVSGRDEVYLQPRDRSIPAMRVSGSGGNEPRWSPDGDRLYFRQGNLMLAADVRRRPALAVGDPRVLFDGGWQLEHDKPWSVMPDGKRFLMVRFEPAAIPTRLDVIVNWFDELRKRAPVK